MFKYDPCVYETYNHYPHYLRIYFDDYPYLTYAHRAVYWTIAPSRHFSKRARLALGQHRPQRLAVVLQKQDFTFVADLLYLTQIPREPHGVGDEKGGQVSLIETRQ